MMPVHEDLLRELQGFALTAPTVKSVMERISQRLHEKMTRYNWVGFYLVDPADPGILVIGPFVGSFTPNLRIPLDTGLCGAAGITCLLYTSELPDAAGADSDPRWRAAGLLFV